MSIYSKTSIFKFFVFSILLLSFVFSANAYKIRSTWYKGKKYIYLNDVASFYGMKLARYKKYCVLNSRYSTIRMEYNSKVMEINNVKVYASLPIIVTRIGKNWIVLMSDIDFQLLLDPILRKNVLSKQNVKTVIIDPGHGGKDSGAKGKYSKEKDLALSISQRLANILSKYGYKVVMTRNRDVYIDLEDRPNVIKKFGGDIFISIHCNSVKNSSVQGVETFIYSPAGTISTHGGSVTKSNHGNRYNKNNARLGYDIQKQLSTLKSPDRGLKRSQFKVLRLSRVPAVLVEVGFISSPREEYLLRQEKYQSNIASRIAKGVLMYSKDVRSGK